MNLQGIPINSAPGQNVNVAVEVDGQVLSLYLSLVFNEVSGYWSMDVADANQNPLVQGVALVTGLNLLRQYQYLGIGSVYLINSTGVDIDYPNTGDLGSDFQLVWGDSTQVGA